MVKDIEACTKFYNELFVELKIPQTRSAFQHTLQKLTEEFGSNEKNLLEKIALSLADKRQFFDLCRKQINEK